MVAKAQSGSSRNLRNEGGVMRRREMIAALAAQPLLVPRFGHLAAAAAISPCRGSSRVRLGDPAWPSPAEWDGLRQRVGNRLIAVQSPFQPCREAPIGEACRTLFRELKNPYYIGDDVGLTQTTGWSMPGRLSKACSPWPPRVPRMSLLPSTLPASTICAWPFGAAGIAISGHQTRAIHY